MSFTSFQSTLLGEPFDNRFNMTKFSSCFRNEWKLVCSHVGKQKFNPYTHYIQFGEEYESCRSTSQVQSSFCYVTPNTSLPWRKIPESLAVFMAVLLLHYTCTHFLLMADKVLKCRQQMSIPLISHLPLFPYQWENSPLLTLRPHSCQYRSFKLFLQLLFSHKTRNGDGDVRHTHIYSIYPQKTAATTYVRTYTYMHSYICNPAVM